MTNTQSASSATRVGTSAQLNGVARYAFLTFGWINVALGIIGAALPVMPTTVFLLIALWAFSRSSPRFQAWLLNHPRFGPTLRAWRSHRVIPLKAKLAAVTMMGTSVLGIALFADWPPSAVVAFGLVLGTVSAFIVLCPGRPSRAALGDSLEATAEAGN